MQCIHEILNEILGFILMVVFILKCTIYCRQQQRCHIGLMKTNMKTNLILRQKIPLARLILRPLLTRNAELCKFSIFSIQYVMITLKVFTMLKRLIKTQNYVYKNVNSSQSIIITNVLKA